MAINSKSKLRDVLADERAVAIIEKYVPGFTDNPALGPCMGMRMSILLGFPQAGLPDGAKDEILAALDALDA